MTTMAWRAAEVLAIVATIPPGRVATYGQVAALAGQPRHGRQVGRLLATAPAVGLPWHRVVAAGGRIALPRQGAAGREQVRRLRGEGIPVQRGRIDLARYQWQPGLDELLWGAGFVPAGS
jgi:methylated-DNA-protein-cysteine methyltransferase-like protein